MKNHAIPLLIAFCALAQAASAITVVGNSIDLPLAEGFLDNYLAQGIPVETVSADEFQSHENDSLIMFLGGQNAPEGVGEIVGGILTEREKNELLNEPDARVLAIDSDVWAQGQKVMVFAGHGKEQTRRLFGDSQPDVLKGFRFNDSALPDNVSGPEVAVPALEPGQQFTELNANQANALMLAEPNIMVVDVRATPFYDAGHVPGAVNIPERKLLDVVDSLDKEKTYLLYCGGNSESIRAGNELSGLGFGRIYRLVDGYVAWRKAGFPRERWEPADSREFA